MSKHRQRARSAGSTAIREKELILHRFSVNVALVDLVAFVRIGLTDKAFLRNGAIDEGAKRATLCKEIPSLVLSGRALHKFEGCPPN